MSPPTPHIQEPWLEALASRPLRCFGSVGALCSCLGALMLGVVVYQRLSGDNQGLYARPLFLIAVLLLVLGGGMGLVMNAVSPSYDFFLYYFTLVITPMVLLCGVFFPVSQLPLPVQAVSAWLPLTHAIDLARPLVVGIVPGNIMLHVVALLIYGSLGYIIALALTRRRLLK